MKHFPNSFPLPPDECWPQEALLPAHPQLWPGCATSGTCEGVPVGLVCSCGLAYTVPFVIWGCVCVSLGVV